MQVLTTGNVTLVRFEGNLPIAVSGDSLSRALCRFNSRCIIVRGVIIKLCKICDGNQTPEELYE